MKDRSLLLIASVAQWIAPSSKYEGQSLPLSATKCVCGSFEPMSMNIPPPSLSLLGRLHVQSELFSSIFNARQAATVYAQDQDTVVFLFLYLPNKIHCDRAFGHTPLYYILNPPPPCALGRTNARSINTPAQQGHYR